MKNINISFGKLTALTKHGISLLFWVALVIILALELIVLIGAYRVIRRSQEVPNLTVTRQVRVSFPEYDKAIETINSGEIYLPPEESGLSPFGE